MLKLPEEFVAVAREVPFTVTVASGTGLLSASLTVPVTVWAYILTEAKKGN
jgi:hypothetical protein